MPIGNSKLVTNLIIFFIVILIISSVGLVSANADIFFSDQIFRGVSVADVAVGGLTQQQARDKIARAVGEQTANPPIVLTYQDAKWPIAAADISLSVDVDQLAQNAFAVGRTGTILQKIQQRYIAVNYGISLSYAVSFDEGKLRKILETTANQVNRPAKNAQLVIEGMNVSMTQEKNGRQVDMAATWDELIQQLNTHFLVSQNLHVNETVPAITSQDLKDIDGIVASYTTQFDGRDQNRTQNIILAARGIDGTLVRAGEVFSFNSQVGERLAKYGFKEAPAYINGELVPDWGGGVCQVSSTLYNTALLGNYEILERTAHYRPPSYVPLGLDATVADNQLDFRFKNNSNYNVYIMSEVSGNQVSVLILSKVNSSAPKVRIVAGEKKIVEPATVVKQDPELEIGKEIVETEGQKGFQVTTYRILMFNGQEIHREYLAHDEFPPVDRVVRIGTKVNAAAISGVNVIK